MAIAIDKANLGGAIAIDATATTVAFTTTQAVASGGFIVLSVSWWSNTVNLSSVAGGGLTWTIDKQGRAVNPTNPSLALVSAQAPSGLASGTTITATYSATTFSRKIAGTSFTGVATSSPVDGTPPAVRGSNGAAAAWASNAATIAAGSVLIATNYLENVQTTSTPDAGNTEALEWGEAVGASSQTTAYRIEATGGSFTVSGVWAVGTQQNTTVAVAYKTAAGAPAVLPDVVMPPMSH